MIIRHLNLCWLKVYILCVVIISLHVIGVLSTGHELYSRTRRDLFEQRNRDGDLPRLPVEPDLRLESSYIFDAHEVLRVGLQQFLEFQDNDLGTYLNYLIYKRTEPFVDEYGHVIRVFKKVFRFIWEQHNETLVQNYAIGQFNKDKLSLCSVARYLSHQPTVEQRESIIKRMGEALNYTCHPCTPYTPKQYDETIVPSTDGINPEGVSPEESLILCKENNTEGQSSLLPLSSYNSTSPQSGSITTTVEPIKPENPTLDYTPCSYSNGDVICDEIPLEEVQKVFNRTSFPILASVKLILQRNIFSESFIPEDIFGTKRILEILIQYPYEETNNSWGYQLEVDDDAFRSTKSYTNVFKIHVIDCTLLDLGFLSGFDQLTELMFLEIFNVQHCLPSLPPLPRLTTLYFEYCTGMNRLNIFPAMTNGLKVFKLLGDPQIIDKTYNDETVDEIIDWLLLSSAKTLEELTIVKMKKVTRVPHKISSFKSLNIFRFFQNNISTIKSGAFSFSAPVSLLDIRGSGINEIEPGAFQGNFTDAEVWMYDNNLTRFEESVFGPILQQMASGEGFISARVQNGNPIDCSEESICHLAWLNCYKTGFLLKCSNGTSFQDLQPAGFNHCRHHCQSEQDPLLFFLLIPKNV